MGINLKNHNELKYAGFWIRVAATLIDTLIISVFTIPLLFMFYGNQMLLDDSIIKGPADLIISYILPAIAVVVFWVYKSATPGKIVLKLKILDAKTGEQITVRQSIIRYFGYFVSMIPLFFGIFWVAWDSKKQAWHDKIAGTVVVREKFETEKVAFDV